jgi:hypothetical protein
LKNDKKNFMNEVNTPMGEKTGACALSMSILSSSTFFLTPVEVK